VFDSWNSFDESGFIYLKSAQLKKAVLSYNRKSVTDRDSFHLSWTEPLFFACRFSNCNPVLVGLMLLRNVAILH